MSQSSTSASSLTSFLQTATQAGELPLDVKAAVIGLAEASINIAELAARNGISQTALGAVTGEENADGDDQKALDVLADQLIEQALVKTNLFAYLSEEREQPVPLSASGQLICACDPLDGSSNIDANLTIGTIFSLYPAPDYKTETNLLCPGRDQIAAGFFAYGPQTALLLTYGNGVFAFCFDGTEYRLMDWQVRIPCQTSEFAINAANHRHWSARTASYIDQLLAGKQGGRSRNFNMRWAGSLVADCWRILRRGGIFLYPEDSRRGYESGRLRLVYEANPISFLVEQAGGLAIDGEQDILDIQPTDLHQRIPLIFGSADEVEWYKSN
tara:strand:+ start:3406 stop:4389 length:984 start_codon:yes stop_codon:yes gene_type:complete